MSIESTVQLEHRVTALEWRLATRNPGHVPDTASQRYQASLHNYTGTDLHIDPVGRVMALASLLQHEDAIRITEALERIANALDAQRGM